MPLSVVSLLQLACVVRDGQRHVVKASEVVTGDVVELTNGNRIPADLRIISAEGLKVKISTLWSIGVLLK